MFSLFCSTYHILLVPPHWDSVPRGILVPANLLLCALETEWQCFAPFHWFLATTKATILLLQHVSNGNMHSTCQRSQKDIRHGLSNTQDIHT